MAQDLHGLVFFDRGIPDVAGYLRLLNRRVPDHVDKAARSFRYDRRVFIAPPWEEIFEQDQERKQDFDEAVRTCEVMIATYAAYDYELIEIPRFTVEERVQFVLETANAS